MNVCRIPGCYGPPGPDAYRPIRARHQRDRTAPPMRVTCECSTPDIERLRIYGADAAQCRRCGSPITVGGAA